MKYTINQIEKRFEKWGKDNCKKAFYYNRIIGEGANTIGHGMGFTTNQIDAMIDTWEEYVEITSN